MDIKYTCEIVAKMNTFMSEQGFSKTDSGTGFVGNEKFFKITYSDDRKEVILSTADKDSEGNECDYSEITAWYFDENDHGPDDTEVIANDFLDTVAVNLGIKKVTDISGNSVALPTKANAGATPGVEAFTQKFLALFPEFKDNYKENVSKFGGFMYVNFYKTYGVEKMKQLLANPAEKKVLSKYMAMLAEMYTEGDRNVGNIICAIIVCGAFEGDFSKFSSVVDKKIEEYPFFIKASKAILSNYSHNKKLQNAIK